MRYALVIAALVGSFGGLIAYDNSQRTCEKYMSRTFMDGRLAIFERCDGRVFSGDGKFVKYVTRYQFTDVDGTVYTY